MGATAFDSFYLRDRYGSAAMRAIWDDRAMIQRWLDVEAALAEVQAGMGLVPRPAAAEIRRKARVELLDLQAMRRDFDRTWNPVVPVVDALRAVLSPRAARWVHWGATSKNVFDTGTALQIKDTTVVVLAELDAVCAALARLCEEHRGTLMAGRTHGQHAMPITFGYKCAVWLDELLRQRQRLLACRERALCGEFGGAVGTLASLGRRGLVVQDRLMRRLGLSAPRIPSKTAGDRFAEFFLVVSSLAMSLGKVAQNVYNLQVSDTDEACEFSEGKVGSSAMPHKLNPVASGSVVLLGRLIKSRATAVLEYVHCEWEDDHRQGETPWSFAPEICLLLGAQFVMLKRVLGSLIVKPENMLRNLDRSGGAVLSEAVMMALAKRIGRDKAHAHVLALSRRALAAGVPFRTAAAEDDLVRRQVPPKALAKALDYRSSLGLVDHFVDAALRGYRSEVLAARRGGRGRGRGGRRQARP